MRLMPASKDCWKVSTSGGVRRRCAYSARERFRACSSSSRTRQRGNENPAPFRGPAGVSRSTRKTDRRCSRDCRRRCMGGKDRIQVSVGSPARRRTIERCCARRGEARDPRRAGKKQRENSKQNAAGKEMREAQRPQERRPRCDRRRFKTRHGSRRSTTSFWRSIVFRRCSTNASRFTLREAVRGKS